MNTTNFLAFKPLPRAALLVAALAILAPRPLAAQAPSAPDPAWTPGTEYEGAAALGLALRRLGPTPRVLMIAAHPDDENTSVLAALALGQGADVAYLSLTRGEGGQNGIGPELQEAMGLIRSEELLAARRLDGAGQFFSRAYDYGFSKSADEAFTHWPRDSVLADVVAVIRAYRPDVVLPIFGGTPADGHGQHQAAGIVARKAFYAAGDPDRFPEQVARGLAPHRPAALYQARWRGGSGEAITLSTGDYDPLLGWSYHQIALESRGRHRSQDMGRALTPGPQRTLLTPIDTPIDTPADASADAPGGANASIFDGIPTTLAERARALPDGAGAMTASVRDRLVALFEEYAAAARTVRERFNPLAPGAIVPDLAGMLARLEEADALLAANVGTATRRAEPDPSAALRFHLAGELADVRRALALAAGVVFDAVAEHERVVPGQSFALQLSVWNGGDRPLAVDALEPALPAGWRAEPRDPLPDAPLAPGTILARTFDVHVPASAAPSEPYYLRQPRDGAMYRWPEDDALRGLAFEPDEIRAAARVRVLGVETAALPLERAAQYRHVTTVDGESRRPVQIVPRVSVLLEPGVAVLPLAGTGAKAAGPDPLAFTVHLTADAPNGVDGTLRLELPAGWRAEPAAVPLRFERAGESRVVEVAVHPAAETGEGEFEVRAVFETADGARYTRGAQIVDYPHIRPRPLYHDAATTVRAFDVAVPEGLRVAYIPGAGDLVPQALAQLGLDVTLLDPTELAAAELDAYDVVVVGSRAYEHRPDVGRQNARLLEYVERGGTLVVQYNQYTFARGGYAPYPLEIARPHDRVTDETAEVDFLDPSHRALSWPNRISERDFDGWIQERGLYFAHRWDEDRYTPLLAMSDPGEAPLRGGLLVARHGRGTYVYTGLAFFRQLPAGVPGAYRLFVNLLSLGVER